MLWFLFLSVSGATVNNAHPTVDGIVYPDDFSNLTISEEKCIEYDKLMTLTVSAKPLTTAGKPTSVSIPLCDLGVPLIVGSWRGKSSSRRIFLHAIGYNGDGKILWNCGGTLISDRYVMTAAHCYSTGYGKPIRVRLGDLDLQHDQEESQHKDFGIEDIIVHPDYQSHSKRNDIALIKLNSRVQFSTFIRPACLWTKFNVNEETVTATGWGSTVRNRDPTSEILIKVPLTLFANSRCDKTSRDLFPKGLPQVMMCVGDLSGLRDTCQGDSGGPISITTRDKPCSFYVVGITSFGKTCAAENTPSVYTRVSEYIPWLEKNVWQ